MAAGDPGRIYHHGNIYDLLCGPRPGQYYMGDWAQEQADEIDSSYGIVSNEEKGLHSLLQQDYINEKIGGKVTELNSRPCTPGPGSRWYPHQRNRSKDRRICYVYIAF